MLQTIYQKKDPSGIALRMTYGPQAYYDSGSWRAAWAGEGGGVLLNQSYVEHKNSAAGVFITTTGDAHGTNRFEIQLDRAKLVVENDKLSLLEFDVSEKEWTKTNRQPFATMPCHEVNVKTDGLSLPGEQIIPFQRLKLIGRRPDGLYHSESGSAML